MTHRCTETQVAKCCSVQKIGVETNGWTDAADYFTFPTDAVSNEDCMPIQFIVDACVCAV